MIVRFLTSLAAGAFALAAVSASALAWPSPHTLGPFAYLSPAPGSGLHLRTTNVIVRPGGIIDPTSIQDGVIQATGSLSGAHAGTTRLSDDGETIVFRPDVAFDTGETVTCTVASGLRTANGDLPGTQFTFTIVDDGGTNVEAVRAEIEESERREMGFVPGGPRRDLASPRVTAATDTLPSDFPAITATRTGTTGDGNLFLCSIRFDDPAYTSYLMILGDDGWPVLYRRLPASGFDFKVQPTGRVTYCSDEPRRFYAWNGLGAVVDSFEAGNGYFTDIHELQMLPDGHALLMAYDPHVIDMSAVTPGGNPAAVVSGLIVQELDRAKDVVFEWRSWDHFQITDVTSRSVTAPTIDYAHGNAIEKDVDGNLMISSRHMDEITKISREDGHVIWRWGGKNNEFTFVNDPGRFSQQHSIRRLPNGHVMLYDNGNFHLAPHSRAVEYALDEKAKTATLVWEYRTSPDTYGVAMGSVQRLANGHTVIGWGATGPALTEVTPAGEKVEEIAFPNGVFSYRAFRHPWPPLIAASLAISPSHVDAGHPGEEITTWIRPENALFFSADSIDTATVRLRGTIPALAFGPVDPDRGLPARFPLASLLPYLRPGRQSVDVEGSLVSGERFRASAEIEITGEKRVHARMASPVGAWPLRIAFRSDGASPRTVTMAAYDATGRRVRRWTVTIGGSGEVTWDGRGGNGERLASGIYFVGTEGTAIDEMARVVLVK
jgi:arylsulfotransferase ASST